MAKEDLKSYKIFKLISIISTLFILACLCVCIFFLYILSGSGQHPVYWIVKAMIFCVFVIVCIADILYNLIRYNSFKKLYNDLGNDTINRKTIKFKLDTTNTYKTVDIVLSIIELIILPYLVFPLLLKILGIYHAHLLKKELEEIQYFEVQDKSIKEGE